jgi:hypothetical protein
MMRYTKSVKYVIIIVCVAFQQLNAGAVAPGSSLTPEIAPPSSAATPLQPPPQPLTPPEPKPGADTTL